MFERWQVMAQIWRGTGPERSDSALTWPGCAQAVDAPWRAPGLPAHAGFPRTSGPTPESLSAITGRAVTSATVLDGASGTSSRARLALTGTDVPESVLVKMSAAGAGIRMLGELAGLGETETNFYRHLAAELGSGVPRSYGADFDPLTGRYVVVLEDMTTSPCQFPDTLHPLDKDQMGQLIECFAHLHATFWGGCPTGCPESTAAVGNSAG